MRIDVAAIATFGIAYSDQLVSGVAGNAIRTNLAVRF